MSVAKVTKVSTANWSNGRPLAQLLALGPDTFTLIILLGMTTATSVNVDLVVPFVLVSGAVLRTV